jgi:hypothetical protein
MSVHFAVCSKLKPPNWSFGRGLVEIRSDFHPSPMVLHDVTGNFPKGYESIRRFEND